MNKTDKRKAAGKNLLRIILLILCGAVLGINVYLANANRLVGNALPMPFGYGAAVVLSGSMEPNLSKDDLIIVKKADAYKPSDIVIFQDGRSLVVHRIIDMDGETVTTKGDANNTADKPIERSQIKGKVLFSIPFAGKIVNFMKTPVGVICIIIAVVALIEIPHGKDKKKNDEEVRKILEEIERLKKEREL